MTTEQRPVEIVPMRDLTYDQVEKVIALFPGRNIILYISGQNQVPHPDSRWVRVVRGSKTRTEEEVRQGIFAYIISPLSTAKEYLYWRHMYTSQPERPPLIDFNDQGMAYIVGSSLAG